MQLTALSPASPVRPRSCSVPPHVHRRHLGDQSHRSCSLSPPIFLAYGSPRLARSTMFRDASQKTKSGRYTWPTAWITRIDRFGLDRIPTADDPSEHAYIQQWCSCERRAVAVVGPGERAAPTPSLWSHELVQGNRGTISGNFCTTSTWEG